MERVIGFIFAIPMAIFLVYAVIGIVSETADYAVRNNSRGTVVWLVVLAVILTFAVVSNG